MNIKQKLRRVNIVIVLCLLIVPMMLCAFVMMGSGVNAAPPQWQTGNVQQVSAGPSSTCAISSGEVYCWGKNNNGQIGNGTTTNVNVPVRVNAAGVLAGKTVTQVSVGDRYACAIADGAAYCWGLNESGQLGDGTTTSSSVPVAVNATGVLAGKTVTQLSAGEDFVCAIANGAVYCWGDNTFGQLGNGSGTYGLPNISTSPVAVNATGALAGKTVTQISSSPATHTCAIASGDVYCWGLNSNGELGASGVYYNNLPIILDTDGILEGQLITHVATGDKFTCVVASSSVYCLGYNFDGALGDGTNNNSDTPVAVIGEVSNKTVTSLSSGTGHVCAVADGSGYCWGNNSWGKLGDGTSNSTNSAVAVEDAGVLAGKTMTQIAVSHTHSCSVADDSSYCWGYGYHGALGDGTDSPNVKRLSPIYVTTRAADLSDKKITSVSFSIESGKRIMTVGGEYMVNYPDPQEYIKGSEGVSLVALDGIFLDFCTDGIGYDSALLTSYGIVGSTDTSPCYYLFGAGLSQKITDKEVKLWLPNDFDITAQGTVSVNGSAPFTFNQQLSAMVGDASLENRPVISKRPTFNGKAEPGATVTVTVRSDPVICTTTTDSNGNWSCTLPSDLPPGEHTVTIRVSLTPIIVSKN